VLQRILRLWFGLEAPVAPRAYLVSGLSLLALMYLGEAAVLLLLNGQLLTLSDFLDPVVGRRLRLFGPLGSGVIALWALPFLWIGLSMSCRRAVDAGLPPYVGVAFVAPFLNWALLLLLAVLPSRPAARAGGAVAAPATRGTAASAGRWRAEVAAIGAAVAIGSGAVALFVYVLGEYAFALFALTPVLMGFACGVICAHGGLGRWWSLGIGQIALGIVLAGLIVMDLEGLICVLMCWPLGAALLAIGVAVGHHLAIPRGARAAVVLLAVLLLPCAAWDGAAGAPPELRAVTTAVEVDAPPMVVWRRVVAFPDLPPPDGIFALGIACPLRAVIHGAGVGAVRHCEFTTGDFVEPITAWEPGRRLGFDVVAQPPAMRELSFWPEVKAPHLDGYLESRRGEFRLIALPEGRTRLEGTTWYQVDVHPEAYWALWVDHFIHAIHARVLGHIAALAAADRRAAAGR
jgi:hypothetical protein